MKLKTSLALASFVALCTGAAAANAQISLESVEFSGGTTFKPDTDWDVRFGRTAAPGHGVDTTATYPLEPAATNRRTVIEWSQPITAAIVWSECSSQGGDDCSPRRYRVAYEPASPITIWTAMVAGLPAPPPQWILLGRRPSPIDAWIMQAEALRSDAD